MHYYEPPIDPPDYSFGCERCDDFQAQINWAQTQLKNFLDVIYNPDAKHWVTKERFSTEDLYELLENLCESLDTKLPKGDFLIVKKEPAETKIAPLFDPLQEWKSYNNSFLNQFKV